MLKFNTRWDERRLRRLRVKDKELQRESEKIKINMARDDSFDATC